MRYLTLILFSIFSIEIYAAPMSYKGSVTSMSDISKRHSFIETNYAYDAKSAIGVKLFHMDKHNRIRDGIEINHIHRLFRQNTKHSQMNWWLFGGVGYMEGSNEKLNGDNHFGTAYASPGIQWDYETKRVYALASHQLIRGESVNHDTTKLKAGFSFYETGFNETQPWFILEASNINGITPKVEITPTIRLINKALYLEAGVSNMGNPKVHLMYTF
jgi:hypothetical protein